MKLLSRIADSPLIYPAVYRKTRRAAMRRFAFGVFYRTDDQGIVVIAVMHFSSNPRRWKTRI